MEVGFIGLGAMGLPMAANLLRAGHTLRVWNRSKDKAAALAALGAVVVDRPADTVGEAGVAITMVSDDAALDEVVEGAGGIGGRLRHGGLHLSMSTVSPALARRLSEYHAQRGAAYVAAPVFGRPDAAEAKRLFVLCAGPDAACARVQPLFDAMGQRTFPLGSDPTRANVVKLAGNFMIMGAMEALAEAMTLGEKHGIAREATLEVLTQTLFTAPLFANYGKQIATHTYEPARFKLPLGLKDANLVLEAAGQARVPMPLAQLVQSRFQRAIAKSRGQLDWSAIGLDVSEDAGLTPGRQ
jgi:3-hydroxyisobutyrate dehydrogenase-like beta-hydroxyacid dehydrogenase